MDFTINESAFFVLYSSYLAFFAVIYGVSRAIALLGD